MKNRTRIGIAMLVLLAPVHASAQSAQSVQKKALTQADWDRWRSIQSPALSPDGKWAAYTLSPQVGDGEFVVRSTTSATEYRIPVGYIGRPNNTPGGPAIAARFNGTAPAGGGGGGRAGGGGGGGAGGPFTADSRYAFVSTQPTKAQADSARAAAASRGRGRGAANAGGAGNAGNANANRNVIMMISLADGKVTPMPEMRSYRLPRDNGKWMIYTTSADSTATDSTRSPNAGGNGNAANATGNGRAGGRAPASKLTNGSTIILRNLDTGVDEKIPDVVAYTFDDSAKVLAYTVGSKDSTKNGLYFRNMTSGAVTPVLTGPGNYRNFAFDRTQKRFVFSSDRDEFGKDSAQSAIYVGEVKTGKAIAVINKAMLPAGMHFASNGAASFNRAATALTLNIQPTIREAVPADSLVDKAVFDLWSWKDPQLQPTQRLNQAQTRNRSFQAMYNLATKKLVQLTTDSFPNVTVSDDGMHAVASTSVPYTIESMWGDSGNDVYIIDPSSGSRKMIRKKISGSASLSVDGKYVLFFDRGSWFTYNIATGKETNITASATGVRFDQETFSTPGIPGAWGISGWTRNDQSVLINDRFDIWEIDPNGVRPPVVVTDSVGRRENITFRIIQLEPRDERWIDPSKPLMLSAFDEDTKASGFWRDRLGAVSQPEKIVMDNVRYGTPVKARNAEEYMLTKSTFVDFPNLYVGPSLTNVAQISDANPWQKEYNWGTAELVTWTSMDGKPLQGILYKPENFDPNKKYPMISYFYEDLSDGLYSYVPPTGRNVINPTHYVSNGYIVFEPDIYYEIGHPGQSAVKSIVPGVMKLLERGYIDPKGLGLQGQSWGGYQTAYLITQSQMFSAAMAGAPVANMTSAYGGIRWGSGIARAVQYEDGQSRIGKSIWDAPDLYLENSPLFHLPRVTTPLFIMSNDADDAVPWYQGIELFVGMRRLGKEVYLIDYNNDVHNPASRANQKDIAMRMQQFFDTKLKGAPAPDWMVHGIPAVDKGRDQIILSAPSSTSTPPVTTTTGGGN
jgi:dipeptidyl aminopeptidase/acylaminoacyl peptidase